MRYLSTVLVILALAVTAQAQTPAPFKGTVQIDMNASDAVPANATQPPGVLCGVAYVQVWLGTTPISPQITNPLTIGGTAYRYMWDTTKTPNGTYAVTVKVTDKSGMTEICDTSQPNVYTAPARTITVANFSRDVTPPTVTFTLTQVAGTPEPFREIKVHAADESSISRIELFVNNTSERAWTGVTDASYTWNTRPWKGRTVTIRAEATDAENNKGFATEIVRVP